MTTGAREGYAFTVSCKTSAVFIMQTCKCLAVIEENKLDGDRKHFIADKKIL